MIRLSALVASASIIAIGAVFGAPSAFAQNAVETAAQEEDAIYLEADQLIDRSDEGILIAKGDVQARYGTRTLRADEVTYYTETGQVIANGNVVIIDDAGGSQYSDRVELNNKLESAGAGNFTARLPGGGIASAAYAVRRSDEGIELYNAYYTACEPCEDSEKAPTWRLKARRVSQDKENQMIHYRDAVFEFKGIPIFYTPYLAHPDPESERRSGFLIPFGGRSGAYGVFYEQPYLFALSPYSELIVTPRIMERVNPLLIAEYNRNFNSGGIEIEGSFTYDSFFDNRGRDFDSSDTFINAGQTIGSNRFLNLEGERLRSHLFARGEFDINETWSYGFGIQTATDAFYLDRYDIDQPDLYDGLVDGGGRRLVQQGYLVGQNDNFRYSLSGYGFQSLRGSVRREDAPNDDQVRAVVEDDSALPVVLPRIDAEHYFDLPGLGGRLRAFGDATVLTRAEGDDYTRATAGLDWQKQFYTSQGVSLRPYAMLRNDYFSLDPDDTTETSFNRTVGNIGIDARWTLINPQDGIDWVIEPRVQLTQSFGDAKNDEFFVTVNGVTRALYEEGTGLDLDRALLFSANKASGYDLWQDGFRADVGASFGARWADSQAEIFVGQSFASGYDEVFSAVSGLSGDQSDIITEARLEIGSKFSTLTRLRIDDDGGEVRRVDSRLNYRGDRLNGSLRYYKIDSNIGLAGLQTDLPPEEISGSISYQFADEWSIRYRANRDIDQGLTRREELAFVFNDDCTLIELYFEQRRNNLGLAGNNSSVGIRVNLLTLGGIAPE